MADEEVKTVEMVSKEQAKREELLAEYEKQIAPERDARNTAIDAHEADFAKKWDDLQPQIMQARGDIGERLITENVPQKQRDQVLAMETAKFVEKHEADKHAAAIKIDKDLPKPKKWIDFLEEKAINNDPAVLDLLEEAKKNPDLTIGGESDGKPRPMVMSDLSFKADKDGVRYLRGKDEIITDRGSRLDVKRLDDRDIQAALQIASQKFDMEKGLVLSGDLAFRTRTAEIAGRLGLNVQNMSPEMQKAYDRGQRSTSVLKQYESPSLSNNVSGEIKKPEPVLLKVDPRVDISRLMEMNPGLKAGKNVNSLLMDPEKYMGAMDAWRNSDAKTLEALAHADVNKHDGDLDVAELAKTAPELVVDDAELAPLAKDLILVRDAKTLDARELASPEQKAMYKTSQDRVSDYQAQQQQVDKSLLTRNIDAQDLQKTEAEKAKEKAKELSKEKSADKEEEKDGKEKEGVVEKAVNDAGKELVNQAVSSPFPTMAVDDDQIHGLSF